VLSLALQFLAMPTQDKTSMIVSAMFLVAVHSVLIVQASDSVASDFDYEFQAQMSAASSEVNLPELDRSGLAQASDAERSVAIQEIKNVVSKLLASSTLQRSVEKAADDAAKGDFDKKAAETARCKKDFDARTLAYKGAERLYNAASTTLTELQASLKVVEQSRKNDELYTAVEKLALRAEGSFANKVQALLHITEKTDFEAAENFADSGYVLPDNFQGIEEVDIAPQVKSADDIWPMVGNLQQDVKSKMQMLEGQRHNSTTKITEMQSLINSTTARRLALQTDLQQTGILYSSSKKAFSAADGGSSEAELLYHVTHAAYIRRSTLIAKQIGALQRVQSSLTSEI